MTDKAKELGNRTVTYVKDSSIKGFDYGLTKREWFAGLAMQGFLAALRRSNLKLENIAKESIYCADALLEELSKTE